MYVYIGSLIRHPSCDLFGFRTVYKSGTSSFQECFLHDRPGHFLNKNYRIFCHGLPNGSLTIHFFSLYSNPYSTTRLIFLYYFALWLLYPKTSHDFSFSQDSSILLLIFSHLVFPYLASTIFSKLTLCDFPISLLWLGLPKLVSALGFHSFCFLHVENLWCQSESQQETRQWHSKASADEGALQRCGQHLGEHSKRDLSPRHLHSKRREQATWKRTCLTRALAKSGEDGAAAAKQGSEEEPSQVSPATCCWRAFHWLNQQEVRGQGRQSMEVSFPRLWAEQKMGMCVCVWITNA